MISPDVRGSHQMSGTSTGAPQVHAISLTSRGTWGVPNPSQSFVYINGTDLQKFNCFHKNRNNNATAKPCKTPRSTLWLIVCSFIWEANTFTFVVLLLPLIWLLPLQDSAGRLIRLFSVRADKFEGRQKGGRKAISWTHTGRLTFSHISFHLAFRTTMRNDQWPFQMWVN